MGRYFPCTPPSSAPTEHKTALLSKCAHQGWLPPPFPSPAVIQEQLSCCGFLQPQELNKVCRNDSHECFPEGSIRRNRPAGCGISLGFNSGRAWRIHAGTVPGLPLSRTSGDWHWGAQTQLPFVMVPHQEGNWFQNITLPLSKGLQIPC